MTLEALLFDVDGTIAETEEAHRLSFNDAFKEFGLDWSWSVEDYEKLLATTGGKQRIQRHMTEIGFRVPDGQAPDDLIKRLHERKTAIYNDRLRNGGVPLRPGVARLIREARAAGLKLGIATTTTLENVETLLTANGGPEALSWFDVIGAGDCVKDLKPAPDIYLWVLEKLGLAAADCLAVEDSGNGVRAARAAGVPCLATQATYTRNDDLTGALAVVSHLGEPDKPFDLITGDSFGRNWVSIDLLYRWHGTSDRS
jgi:HAD superfamily hydrolase (TIGR01509 family)